MLAVLGGHRRSARRAVDAGADRLARCRRTRTARCQFELQPADGALRRGAVGRPPASCSDCSPRCTARGPISCLDDQGAGGPAVGRAGGGAVPHDARHRPDRAVDGAPHLGRAVHQEPDERQPRGSRRERRQRRHLRRLAGPERLRLARAHDVLRAARGGAGGGPRRHRRVAASMVPLLGGSNWGSGVSRSRASPSGPDTDTHSNYNEISPGYFRTLGIPLMSGREFTAADAAGAPKVAIVNEAFAKKFNLGRDAVGKRMSSGGTNARHGDRRRRAEREVQRGAGRSCRRSSSCRTGRASRVGSMSFYVRTSLDTGAAAAAPTPAVDRAGSTPNLPVEELKTMPQQVRENVFMDRMVSTLSAAFALAGDAAGGGRPVRRARLHRVAADAGDRAAHGARRRRRRACAR